MKLEQMQAQLRRCCGPVPKPFVRPKPLTGIERERLAELEAIQAEYADTPVAFWLREK